MFIIHAHQFETLDAHGEQTLIRAIRQHIKQYFPEEYAQFIAPDIKNKWIREALKSGRSYCLTTDANLTIFVDFCLVYGIGFPSRESWALDILADENISEDEKTDQLMTHIDAYVNDLKS